MPLLHLSVISHGINYSLLIFLHGIQLVEFCFSILKLIRQHINNQLLICMPVIRTDYTQINTGNYSGVKIQMLARLELRIFRMVAKWEYTFYNYNDWNVYKRGFFKVRIKN